MAVLGLSTLIESAVVWYSAGQALLAGMVVLATLDRRAGLAGARGGWRLGWPSRRTSSPRRGSGRGARRRAGRRGLSLVRRPSPRAVGRPLRFLVVAFACVGGLLLRLGPARRWNRCEPADPRVGVGAKALEACPLDRAWRSLRALVLRNLGIDAPLTGAAGLVLCLALAGCWLRGGPRRANGPRGSRGGDRPVRLPDGLLLPGIHAVRGHRAVGWYHAIPAIGAILFVAGWWQHSRGTESWPADRVRRG